MAGRRLSPCNSMNYRNTDSGAFPQRWCACPARETDRDMVGWCPCFAEPWPHLWDLGKVSHSGNRRFTVGSTCQCPGWITHERTGRAAIAANLCDSAAGLELFPVPAASAAPPSALQEVIVDQILHQPHQPRQVRHPVSLPQSRQHCRTRLHTTRVLLQDIFHFSSLKAASNTHRLK